MFFKHIKKILLVLITLGLGLSALWMFGMEERADGARGQQGKAHYYQGPYQINQVGIINAWDIFDWICGGRDGEWNFFRENLRWNNGKLNINANSPHYLKQLIQKTYPNTLLALAAEGNLEFQTIGDLRKCRQYNGNGRLDIRIHDSQNPNHTDVRALMSDPSNNNAVFQVASTPSALEGGMQRYDRLLQGMAHSPVQGETIAFATAPATIWRKYYEPTWNQDYHDNQKYYLWHLLLSNKAIYSNGRNGKYLDYNKLESAHFDSNNDINFMGVGIHSDVPVITGCGGDIKNNGPQQIILGQNQKVTLALVSAFNVDKFNKFKRNTKFKPSKNNGGETFAQITLDAAYEGTILAAIAKGKKRVFLTIMGGGSFRNDIAWIYESIAKIKDLIRTSGLHVTLIYRPDAANRKGGLRTHKTDEKFLKQFARLINYINNNGSDQYSGLDTEISNYCYEAYHGTLNHQRAQQLQVLFDNLARGQLKQQFIQPLYYQQQPQCTAYQPNNDRTSSTNGISLTALRVLRAQRATSNPMVPYNPNTSGTPSHTPQESRQNQAPQTTTPQPPPYRKRQSRPQPKSSWIGRTVKWFVYEPVKWLVVKPISWLFRKIF